MQSTNADRERGVHGTGGIWDWVGVNWAWVLKRRLTDEVLQAQGGHEADGVHNIWQRVALILELRPGPELSRSQSSLMALAWPENPESQSCGKPGQSHGFQAKPGQNITNRTMPPLPPLTSSGNVLFSYLWQCCDIQGCACPCRCTTMGCKHQHDGQGG